MNTKIIKLDINNKMYETITAKQGDTESRFLLFHLFDASLPFDLTEKSVRVYGIKPDGTKIFNDLVINDVKKGYCTLKLTNQMLAIAGLVKLELVIYSGNKKLSSIPFMLNVISSLNSDDAVVSTNEFTSLMNGLAALSEYDIYKSNAKQVPGIKEEVSNLSSQLENIANLQSDDVKEFQFNATCSSGDWYRLFKIAETSISPLINFNFQLYVYGSPVQIINCNVNIPFGEKNISIDCSYIDGGDYTSVSSKYFTQLRLNKDGNSYYIELFCNSNIDNKTVRCKVNNILRFPHSAYNVTCENLVVSNSGDKIYLEAIANYKTEKGKLAFKKNGNTIEIAWKYNDVSDIMIVFDKFGVNNLMQIAKINLITTKNPTVSTDFSLGRINLSNSHTDWISPIVVEAIDNITGDALSNSDYTGGCHGYTGGSGTATARTQNFNVFLDGYIPIEQVVLKGDKVVLKVRNNIQAWNTKKNDGTGREVLQEIVTYTVTPGNIDVEVEIRALEKIKITTYYGMQVYFMNFWNNRIFYKGNGVNTSSPLTEDRYSPTKSKKQINEFWLCNSDNNHWLSASVLNNYGIGNHAYISDDDYQVRAMPKIKKAYHNLITSNIPVVLDISESIAWRGSYKLWYNQLY